MLPKEFNPISPQPHTWGWGDDTWAPGGGGGRIVNNEKWKTVWHVIKCHAMGRVVGEEATQFCFHSQVRVRRGAHWAEIDASAGWTKWPRRGRFHFQVGAGALPKRKERCSRFFSSCARYDVSVTYRWSEAKIRYPSYDPVKWLRRLEMEGNELFFRCEWCVKLD